MFNTFLPASILSFSLIEQISIVTILAIIVIIFFVLLIVGVIKSFKLKAENKRLSDNTSLQSKEDNKVYKDFTDGHLYDSY